MSYPAYGDLKDSKVGWLGTIPADWSHSRVKYVSRIETGDGDTQDSEADGEYPFFVRSPSIERINRYSHDTEAVLTAGDGAGVGKIFHHFRGKFSAHQRVYIMTDFKGVDARYFFYYFSTMFGLVALDGSAKSTVESVRRPMIADLAITLPPLDEQEQIADFLDREAGQIDNLIAEQEGLVEALAERRKAVISHAVTKGLDPAAELTASGVPWLGHVPQSWDVRAIKWITPVRRGASPRPIDNPIYFDDDGEWAWVRIADVSRSDGRLRHTAQVLSDLGSSLSVKIAPGELFVSIAGTVGKPCIAEIKCCIHDGFVYFPDLRIPAEWLYRIFESGECYRGLGKMGTQLNLNTDTIGSIKIPVPPLVQIRQILTYLDDKTSKIDALILEATSLIVLLKERRTALISAAVTGKIDVRNSNQTGALSHG